MPDPIDAVSAEPSVPETPVCVPPVARRWSALTIVGYAALVILAWVGLELWGLGKAPFHTKGEPREGLVVWQMTHHGSWILPRRDGPTGMEVPSKPPLFHWLGAVTSLIHGSTDEWSIRLPSAALSLITLLCVFGAGTALWSPRAGLCAALGLMTMFEWARASTGARVDMTLTFGLQLALLSLLFFLRNGTAGWLVPLYGGMAVAVLGKGPVGVLLPALVGLVMVALSRDLSLLRRMRLAAGALAVGVVAGGWYVLALVVGGLQFFYKQVLAENVFTFFNSQKFGGGHRHAVVYLLGALLLGVMPWTVFLPGLAARCWRQRREIGVRDARVYLFVWILVVFGFYSLAASKRGVYLLSLYPAIALLLGWWADEQRHAPPEEERWLARIVPVLGWALIASVGLLLALVLLEGLGAPILRVIQGWLPASVQHYAPWISETVRAGRWPLLGLLIIAMAALYVCVRAAAAVHWTGVFAGVFAAATALILSVNLVVLPGIAEHESLRSFMASVRQALGSSHELFFFRTFEYDAVFYWQDHIPIYEGPWPAGAPRYLLMKRSEWQAMRVEADDQYEQVTFADGRAADRALVLIRRTGR
jgi:4-amino-4-deoxy-L-arabinose transferase-like glycosyltransferase